MPVGLKTGIYAAIAIGAYLLYRAAGGGTAIGERIGGGIGSGIGGFGLGLTSGFQRSFSQYFQGFDLFNFDSSPSTPAAQRTGGGNTPGNARRGAGTVHQPDTASGRIYPITLPWLPETVYVDRNARDYYRDAGVI